MRAHKVMRSSPNVPHGCFYKLGVRIVRALLFGVHIGAPDFCQTATFCIDAWGLGSVSRGLACAEPGLEPAWGPQARTIQWPHIPNGQRYFIMILMIIQAPIYIDTYISRCTHVSLIVYLATLHGLSHPAAAVIRP